MSATVAAIGIPDELRDREQWVVWRREERDGKTTKVPYQAAAPARRARSTDPATWTSFDQALATFKRGSLDGIGFVFSKDDPYAGVDFDHCIDVNGELHPAVAEYVAFLDSYTEVSPSGTGLHVIVRGKVEGRKRTERTPWGGSFETYSEERFFTMTGNAYRASVPR